MVERWGRLTGTEHGQLETPAGPARYLAIPLRSGDQTLGTFVVANFLRRERSGIDRIVRLGAAVAASVLVGASAVAWLVAGRLLRPVRVLTETARSIGESDLSRRIEVRGSDEVAELGRTFNHMLDRLEGAFTTQQAFLDDAGHELRTPITIVRGHLELLDEDPDDRRATVALVLDELDRMSRIVNDLLLLAKVEQPDFLRPEPLDLGDLTRGWHARARTLADRDWRLEHTAEAGIVADGQRLTQAVMNLAQNAVQHTSRGPASTSAQRPSTGRRTCGCATGGRGSRPRSRSGSSSASPALPTAGAAPTGRGSAWPSPPVSPPPMAGPAKVESRPGGGSTFTIIVPTTGPESN